MLIKSNLRTIRLLAERATLANLGGAIINLRSPCTRASHTTGLLAAQNTAPNSMEERQEFFGLTNMFTIEEMMAARVHFGHQECLLNPHMRPYIFGKRLGVLIFDLEKSARMLELSLLITAEIAFRKGIIMFTHPSRQSAHLVEDAARECGEYAYCRRWRNQVFTNSTNLFGAVTRMPDLVILFSAMDGAVYSHRAIKASAKLLIPTIAICDTNVDPTLVTYPVAGNDDSPQSIEFYCKLFKEAVLKGKTKRKEVVEELGENHPSLE